MKTEDNDKNFIRPLNYTASNGNLELPELNFIPTRMYVCNNFDDAMELKIVLGKYNGYYLATNIKSIVTLKTKFTVEPFRFAISEKEVKERTYLISEQNDNNG